jgi:tRNA(fMet)-specific endonuclease VapC
VGVTETLITLMPVQPLPTMAGAAYGAGRSLLERRGEVIGNNDLWIAAHALTGDLVLVTNNRREFDRVPDLKAADWTSEA